MNSLQVPTDTCVGCNASFPPNNELASVPRARRIAFDPALGRVWRICTKCGHWNLIGAEASAAAAAELRARLPLIHRPGIVHDALGRVGVITVSADDDAPAAGSGGLQARRFMRHGSWLRPILAALPFGGILWAIIADPSAAVHLDLWQLLGVMVLGDVIGNQIANWRLKRRVAAWSVAASTIVLAALAFVVPHYSSAKWFGAGLTLGLVAFGATMTTAFELMFGRRRIHLVNGTTIRLTKPALRDVLLGHASGTGELAAFGVSGKYDVYGAEAATVVGALSDELFGKPSAEEIERGWILLRRHGDLAGLVGALDVALPDSGGRHSWSDLPMPWRVALQIGSVEATGSKAEREALRKKIREASDVAAIAENLDP